MNDIIDPNLKYISIDTIRGNVANAIIGELIADEKYCFVNTRAIASVVRDTVKSIFENMDDINNAIKNSL